MIVNTMEKESLSVCVHMKNQLHTSVEVNYG
jgi:hypothetical protein